MAIKSFDTLIKLHKRRADIMRREMLAFEDTRNQLQQLSRSLTDELNREVEIATSDAKMAGFFGAYSQRVRKRQEEIAEEVKKLEAKIEAKREAIRAEFTEQKKFEIARANAVKKLAEKDRARQQSRFDEIGSQQYLKQQEALKENPV